MNNNQYDDIENDSYESVNFPFKEKTKKIFSMSEKKLNFLIIFLGIIGILFLLVIQEASAADINYTFDDYNDGALAGQGPWLLDDGTMSVGSSYDYDSNGKGVRGSISSFAGVYTSDISSQTSGLDVIDFYMKVNTETSYAKMRIQTTGGTENWVIGRSNTSGEYWRLQECVSTCNNVSVLSGVKNNDVWHHLYFQGRTSDGLVRAKLDDGEWSEWGGSGVFRQIESISIDGGSGEYVYYDDISITSSTPPAPINNLSFAIPNATTTSDFSNWWLNLYTDQEYGGSHSFHVYYGATTTALNYHDYLGPSGSGTWDDPWINLPVPDINATSTWSIPKSRLFNANELVYYYGAFVNGTTTIATTSINYFIVNPLLPTPYYTPSPPATTTDTIIDVCGDFGWPVNWVCDMMAFLFIPSQSSINEFMDIQYTLDDKIPFGYFTAIKNEWYTTDLSSTTLSAIEIDNPFSVGGAEITIFDIEQAKTNYPETFLLIRNATKYLFWILFSVYVVWRAINLINI